MKMIYALNGAYLSKDLSGLYVNQTIEIKQDYSNPWVQFNEKPESVDRKIVKRKTVSATRDGVLIDLNDWLLVKEQLASRKDDDGDWLTLEDEFAHRKHLEGVTFEHETFTEWEPVEFTIVDIASPGDLPPFTLPLRLAIDQKSKDPINLTFYEYKPNALELCKTIGEEYGFNHVGIVGSFKSDPVMERDDWCIPSHSVMSLEFIKIGGSYANYKMIGRINACVGTVEECRKVHAENVRRIREFWKLERALRGEQILAGVLASEVLKDLLRIQEQLKPIRAIQKHSSNLSVAEKMVGNLVEKLKKEVK